MSLSLPFPVASNAAHAFPLNGVDAKSPAVSTNRIAFALAPPSRDFYRSQFSSAAFEASSDYWIDFWGRSPQYWEETLLEINPTVLVTSWETATLPVSLARPDSALRYVCHLAGSVKRMVPRAFLEKGMLVSNWGTQINHAVAEHAMLLLLGTLRNIGGWDSAVKSWGNHVSPFSSIQLGTRSLRGSRVGLHGFGGIARELTRMLQGFGVEVSSYSQGVPKAFYEQHGVRPCESLEELFSTCDILMECEALTPQTAGSVTEGILRLLPPDAVFINIARAPIVNEEALLKVVAEGRLRVGLDVFHEEPLSPKSPLVGAPHAVLSPHIAGPTSEMYPQLADFAIRNIREFLRGGKIEGLVNLETYDRAT